MREVAGGHQRAKARSATESVARSKLSLSQISDSVCRARETAAESASDHRASRSSGGRPGLLWASTSLVKEACAGAYRS
ncbi:hypothetical protein Q9G87_49765 [Nonomuraea sp. G32]|nr:hypothetical protein [Nonomuraea sp. G32]MDP4510115.1 hypothetical protein [Nonomuraea sp. G32]